MVYKYDGIDINITRQGSGEPVFLLHGWGCTGDIFKHIGSVLSTAYTTYSFDFPGFGASDEPTTVWGVEEYTRSIEALAQTEGMENPILIGHSFGGRVSIVYASRNKVQKVMLVDAAGVKPKRSLTYYRKVYTFKLIKKLLPLVVGKARAEKIIEQRRAKAGSSDYSQATPMMRAILSKVVNEDLCHLMPKIAAPTLLFWGRERYGNAISRCEEDGKIDS